MKKSFSVIDNDQMKRQNDEDSIDTSKSINVVVDVHQELKQMQLSNNDNENIDERHTSSRGRTLGINKKNPLTRNLGKQKNFQKGDKVDGIDSIEAIEDFRESFFKDQDENQVEQVRNNNQQTTKSQTFIPEQKLHSRKSWNMSIEESEIEKRPTRKRWSKSTSVIHLPDSRGNFWRNKSSEIKIPLVETSSEMFETTESAKHLFGVDNIAFESENEEILRVETSDSRKSTKIEMKEIVRKSEQVDAFVHSKNLSSETFQEEIVAVDGSNKSDSLDDQSIESQKNSIHSAIEHFAKMTSDEESSDGRSKSRSMSNSLRDLSENSDIFHSENDDHNLNNKKGNRRRESIDDSKDARKYSTSTLDDDVQENHLIESPNEFKSRKVDAKKRRSKLIPRELETKQRRNKNKDSLEESSKAIPVESKRKKGKTKKKSLRHISVTVHRADMLEVDYVTKHPMVKIHIVNAEDGKYLKTDNESCSYLQPMITGKFDFKENKSITPVWEEELVFEHNFEELLKTENQQILIFFEIVDLLTFAEASLNYDKFGSECCLHKIAWAFLRPVGTNNALHTDKKIRLQLYKPRKHLNKFQSVHICEVYTWWKSKVRKKYPSSLFVTIKPIEPTKSKAYLYQQLTLHNLSNTCNESQKLSNRTSDSISLPKWNRLAAQSCKIPNDLVFETETSGNGCFYVTFSNDGKYFACTISEEHDYPISVYEVETKIIHVRFAGHKSFIYSLNWSNNDNYLLSVSSDQTARIWSVKNQIVQHIQMMPHPSYIYCGKFEPENSWMVATGCYDRIVRVWMRKKKSESCELSQELEGHEGFVNSMCFKKNGRTLLSADSVGTVILWTMKKSRRMSHQEWHISRKIKVREIDGIIINTIVLHPLESRLLLHSRNNELRMLDLATGVVLQKYNQLNNQRVQTTACISPCGSLILCGGEDSSLNVWNLENGNLVAKYTFDRNYRAVTCVDYHPYDHVLAFSTFGSPSAVKILRFNKDAIEKNVGLKIMSEYENAMKSNSTKSLDMAAVASNQLRVNNIKDEPKMSPKGRNLQSNRTNESSLLKSCDNVSSENAKYDESKLKLQRLNLTMTGQTLKSRSADRLYNIIEKIDRILSNTSRSSGDVECGENLQESSRNEELNSLRLNLEGRRSREEKSRRTHQYFDLYTMTSDNENSVELPALERRSNTPKISTDETSNTVLSNRLNHQRFEIYNEVADNVSKRSRNVKSASRIKEDLRTEYKDNYSLKDDYSSSNSAGTYTIENPETRRNSNIVKHTESESSLLSNATFTIENEVPIPKPRKKKN